MAISDLGFAILDLVQNAYSESDSNNRFRHRKVLIITINGGFVQAETR
jgi:hypothetical protein